MSNEECFEIDLSPLNEEERSEFKRLLKKLGMYKGDVSTKIVVPYWTTRKPVEKV